MPVISTGSVFILSFIALPSGVQWRPDDSLCVDGARIRSRGQRGTLARKPANHRPRPGETCSTSPGRPSLSYRLALMRPRKRSEEHTSELQSLMRISYVVFCLTKTNNTCHYN